MSSSKEYDRVILNMGRSPLLKINEAGRPVINLGI